MRTYLLQIISIVCMAFLTVQTTNGQHFGEYRQSPGDVSSEVVRTSFYISMRDGTRLALDMYKPVVPPEKKIPALVEMTRYWRRPDLGGKQEVGKKPKLDPLSQQVVFARRGYVVLSIDVRGTGASFGKNDGPWSPVEVQDGFDICEWIVKQKWSNKRVGSYGVSYDGTSAAMLAACGHESVKIVVPTFNEFDIYRDIVYPGGVFNKKFVQTWSQFTDALDRNLEVQEILGDGVVGPAPVDKDVDRKLVKQAISEHSSNPNLYELAKSSTYSDSKMSIHNKWSFGERSIKNYVNKIRKSGVFVYCWGSWLDAKTAPAVVSELNAFKPNVRAVIGPWSHGAAHHASPFLHPNTRSSGGGLTMTFAWLRAFDFFLKDKPNGFLEIPELTYYTMGTEQWNESKTWPIAEFKDSDTRWFLKSGGKLETVQAPLKQRSTINYPVDFKATTGTNNRWLTQLGNDVIFSTDGSQSGKRITFTSSKLKTSYEITGTPEIHIEMSSSHTENHVAAYLEAIAPNGAVVYLSEGHINTGFRNDSPIKRFEKSNWKKYVPGKMMKIEFPFYPTSVVLRKGFRLRVSLAGHDAGTFTRIPAFGNVQWTVKTDSSFINIPMKLRGDLDSLENVKSLKDYCNTFLFKSGAKIQVSSRDGFLHISPCNQTGLRLLESAKNRFGKCDQILLELINSIRSNKSNDEQKRSVFVDFELAKKASADIKQASKIEVIGTMDRGGMPISVLRCSFEGETVFANVVWSAADWKILAIESGERSLASRRYWAIGSNEFTAIDCTTPSSISFSFSGSTKDSVTIQIGNQVGKSN